MRAGDYALARKGTWAKVISISAVESEQTVYNFEVEEDHDYFVGATALLVHNGLCFSGSGPTPGVIAITGDSATGAWPIIIRPVG